MPIPHLIKPDPGREGLRPLPARPWHRNRPSPSGAPAAAAAAGGESGPAAVGVRPLPAGGAAGPPAGNRGRRVLATGTQAPPPASPALRIRPRKDTGSCPFLIDSRCTVHEARPLACALYPLGQTIALPEGAVSYFMQEVRCGERAPGQTLARSLSGSGMRRRRGTHRHPLGGNLHRFHELAGHPRPHPAPAEMDPPADGKIPLFCV